jgi:tRNA pseudouridine55 synthase
MRKGKEVALAAKTVHIDEIELTDFNAETMQMSIRVVCGKGTYIRSLARDIGRALQSGAYLTALCRTRLGAIRMEDCITIDDFPQWLEQQEVETSNPLNTETSK